MLIRRLYTAYALLTFLDQADAVAQQLRPLLHEQDLFPPAGPGSAGWRPCPRICPA